VTAALGFGGARMGRILLMLPLLVLLAGCYETDEAVFTADEGEAVAGLEGRYVAEGGALAIAHDGTGGDYRFTLLPKNDKPASGSLRLVPLKPSLALVQAHLDGEPAERFYYLLFALDATGGRIASFERLDADEAAAKALAARLGVRFSGSAVAGDRLSLARFLKGLAELPLSRGEGATYTRVD